MLTKVEEWGISVLRSTTNEEKEFKAKSREWKKVLKKEGKGRKELKFKENLLYVRLLSL